MLSKEDVIRHTKQWVNEIVVKLNLCPFAKYEVEKDSIRYVVFEEGDIPKVLEFLMVECDKLDANKDIETSLLIFPQLFKSFDDYLDFVDMGTILLKESGYEGIYQLATFHPDYCFYGEDPSDNSNFTNRSPYPMLHLLRENSLEQAIDRFPLIESIPKRNIELMRSMDTEVLVNLLKACMKV